MFAPVARPQVLALRNSQIRQVANAAMGREDVLAFWFGESDLPTPAFIREAAAGALADGRTFYTHNLGRADLREALSAYLTRLHGTPIGTQRLAITNSGVSALMVAAQAVVSPGDRVVVVDYADLAQCAAGDPAHPVRRRSPRPRCRLTAAQAAAGGSTWIG